MQLDDETLLTQFRDLSLNPENFGHCAHLRIGWLYLHRLPLHEACARMCADTRAYAESLGARGKFHHTVTGALMRIIDVRMHTAQAFNPGAFDAFLAANRDLLDDAVTVLARHYSAELLDSAAARQHWVAPDLAPIEIPASGCR